MSELRKGVDASDNPSYAVVCNSPQHCVGVFSWHHDEDDAQHNAALTGGQLVPVDYVNGQIIIPPLAGNMIKKFIKEKGLTELDQLVLGDEFVDPFSLPNDE